MHGAGACRCAMRRLCCGLCLCMSDVKGCAQSAESWGCLLEPSSSSKSLPAKLQRVDRLELRQPSPTAEAPEKGAAAPQNEAAPCPHTLHITTCSLSLNESHPGVEHLQAAECISLHQLSQPQTVWTWLSHGGWGSVRFVLRQSCCRVEIYHVSKSCSDDIYWCKSCHGSSTHDCWPPDLAAMHRCRMRMEGAVQNLGEEDVGERRGSTKESAQHKKRDNRAPKPLPAVAQKPTPCSRSMFPHTSDLACVHPESV